MAITIKDIAKEAGVSTSTVSRVISDDASISLRTKEKVRKIMKELKYYPNINARRLVNQTSNVIGLVLPMDSDNFYQNPFFPTVLRGINETLSESHYSLLLFTGNSDEERLDKAKQLVLGKQVDGLIFLYSRAEDPIVDFLMEVDFPFVIIGSPISPRINYIDNNNQEITYSATEYLIGQGANKIAFIGGDFGQRFVQQRYEGYLAALRAQGIPLDERYVFQNLAFTRSSGMKLGQTLLELPGLDAVIVIDSLVAEGMRNYWLKHEVNNICLLTFQAYNLLDELDLGEIVINLQAAKLGQNAFQMLMQLIDNQLHGKMQAANVQIIEASLVK